MADQNIGRIKLMTAPEDEDALEEVVRELVSKLDAIDTRLDAIDARLTAGGL